MSFARTIAGLLVPAFVGSGPSHKAGLVPDPGATAGATRFLCEDGTFAAIPMGQRRQTVLYGPVSSTGLPNFLPATAAALSLTTQNISSTTPLVVTAAGGYGTGGAIDRRGAETANLTWAGLTASATNYLYVEVSAAGALTAGATTTAPTYPLGNTYATGAGAYTFSTAEMVGKLGDGSAANAVWRVYVGEAITNGSAVTATVAYAYRGLYVSPWTAYTAGTVLTLAPNLGVLPRSVEGYQSSKSDGVCTGTSDYTMPMSMTGYAASNTAGGKSVYVDRNTLKFRARPNFTYTTTADNVDIATDSGYVQFTIDRGW